MNTQSKVNLISQSIIELIRNNAAEPEEFKPVHSPILFGSNAKNYINDCLDTTWVSTGGSYVNKFSEELSKFTGAKYVVPVASGTAAIKLALLSLNIEPSDEVLVPGFTFVATANAVAHIGANPHFVDIEDQTLGIDPKKLNLYLSKC